MVHVPYRSKAPALADLVTAGEVYFANPPAPIEYIRVGAPRLGSHAQTRPEFLRHPPGPETVPGYS